MSDDYDYESLGSNATLGQDAMAGALAGIAEHCAMYPVDSIKVHYYLLLFFFFCFHLLTFSFIDSYASYSISC